MHNLNPPLKLEVIDIDGKDVLEVDRARYDLQVPVMVLGKFRFNRYVQLPRVPPRLNSEGLFKWLQKVVTQTIGLN